MSDSKFKQDLIECLRKGYDGVDGVFNFPKEMDETIKDKFIPWIVELVEEKAQDYVKEQDKEAK